MRSEDGSKDQHVELYYRSIIAISAAIDIIITVYFLSIGVNTVFQNIFYFTIVLAAYRYSWRGAYLSLALSVSYLLIFAFFYPDTGNLIQAGVRAAIFIILGFVVAFLSNELNKEKRRYQNIFSASGSAMIVVIGNDRTIAESNFRFLDLFGEGAIVGKRIDAYFEPNDLDRAIKSIDNGEKPHGTEMVMTLQTGEKRVCIVTAGRLNPDEFVLSINDITKRKRAEETLWMMAARNDVILAAIPDIMTEVDEHKRIIWVNQPGMDFYGEDVVGKEASYYFDGEQETYERVQPLFDGSNKIIHLESWQRRKDGKKRLLSWNCKALKDEEGRVTGVISSARDITERKRAEQEREALHSIGEAINTDASLDEILRIIHKNIKKVMYAENCYIALWDEITGIMSFPLFVDQYDPKLTPRASHKGLTEHVLRTERPLLLNPKSLDELVREQGIKVIGTLPQSWLGVPLSFQSKTIGVLVVQSYEPGNSYTDAEKDMLATIGNQAAEVIERKHAEDALGESVQRYELVMEGSSAGLWDWDIANDRIYFSSRWKAIRGFSDAEISDSPMEWSSRLHPDDAPRVTAALQALFEGRTSIYEEEYRVYCKDGSIKWILDRGKTVRDDTGQVIRAAGSEIDITERKLAEEALKQSEERILLLLNSVAEGIYGVDTNGICTFCNSSCLQQLGYEHQDELLGKNMHWLIHAKHPDGTNFPIEECRIYQALKVGEGVHLDDEVFWRSDGTSFPVEYLSYPQSQNGVVVGAVLSFLDITERKLMERTLRENETKYRSMIDNAQDLIFMHRTGSNGQYEPFLDVNARACQVLGYSREELLQMSPSKLNTPESRDLEPERVSRLAEQGKATFEATLMRKDGSTIIMEMNVAVFDLEGVEMAITLARDISERKRAEQALLQANIKLGIMNTITRHDITNQMMVVNGFLELCRQREKDPNLAAYLDKMSWAVANVQEQIAFTKDYQELGIQAPVWVSLGHSTAISFTMLRPPGVVLEDTTNGVEIMADPLVEKVPYNLIDNSIRHGGKITRIKISSEQVGNSLLIVYEDDGVGISPEDRKRLFEKGFGKNTGYGLFLMREILAITGIRIIENGQHGKGVRFEMLVPPGAWRYLESPKP
jgi:PAS domain S-box-containing protein